MKSIKKIIIPGLVISALFLSTLIVLNPVGLFAAEGDAPGTEGYQLTVDCTGSGAGNTGECGFQDFVAQINRIITFLFYFAVIVGTLALIYAGFLLLTSGGNSSKAEEAKKVFYKVVVGFIWILVAFLIVQFIVRVFELKPDYTILEQEEAS